MDRHKAARNLAAAQVALQRTHGSGDASGQNEGKHSGRQVRRRRLGGRQHGALHASGCRITALHRIILTQSAWHWAQAMWLQPSVRWVRMPLHDEGGDYKHDDTSLSTLTASYDVAVVRAGLAVPSEPL